MGERPSHRTLFLQEPNPFSRREFLYRSLVSGTGLLVLKNNINTANCGASDCENRPDINLTVEQREQMMRPSNPIRAITNANASTIAFPYSIRFQRSMGYRAGGVTAIYENTDHRDIHVFLPDLRPDTLEVGTQVLYHEEVHMLSLYNHNRPENTVRDRITEVSGKGRLDAGLYPLVTESEYSTNRLQNNHGHPQHSAFELLASMMTVMRFYPEKFMSRIMKLRSDRDRATLMQAAYAGIEGVLSCSDIPLSVDALQFDPRLLSFLVS